MTRVPAIERPCPCRLCCGQREDNAEEIRRARRGWLLTGGTPVPAVVRFR